MAITPRMEQMAIAVLRGDEAGALALMDSLAEDRASGTREIPPSREITVKRDRLRVVLRTLTTTDNVVIHDREGLIQQVNDWLAGATPLILHNLVVDLYELPEGFNNAHQPHPNTQIRLQGISAPCPGGGTMISNIIHDPPTSEELQAIWQKPREWRTRTEVRLLRRFGAVFGGCCERHADMSGCDCMEIALEDGTDLED